jgi:hypothetical protein
MRHHAQGTATGIGRKIDPRRFEEIQALKPITCHVGRNAWSGYVAFEFAHSSGVVLESPYKGNATYVLTGKWKAMISLSKAEIRTEYRRFHQRIVHRDDWIRDVRRTLRQYPS